MLILFSKNWKAMKPSESFDGGLGLGCEMIERKSFFERSLKREELAAVK